VKVYGVDIAIMLLIDGIPGSYMGVNVSLVDHRSEHCSDLCAQWIKEAVLGHSLRRLMGRTDKSMQAY